MYRCLYCTLISITPSVDNRVLGQHETWWGLCVLGMERRPTSIQLWKYVFCFHCLSRVPNCVLITAAIVFMNVLQNIDKNSLRVKHLLTNNIFIVKFIDWMVKRQRIFIFIQIIFLITSFLFCIYVYHVFTLHVFHSYIQCTEVLMSVYVLTKFGVNV